MEGDGQPKSVISLPKSHSDDLMVLRTRVAQQSELISMLKTRADNTLLEVHACCNCSLPGPRTVICTAPELPLSSCLVHTEERHFRNHDLVATSCLARAFCNLHYLFTLSSQSD